MYRLLTAVIFGVLLVVAGCAGGTVVKPPTPGLEAPTFAIHGTIPGDRPGNP